MADILENVGHWGRAFVSTTRAELPAALAHMEWWWKCVLRAWAFRRACALLCLRDVVGRGGGGARGADPGG